ncbi:MAG TPA: isoleucine--tRNA ligase [Myxococcales bacterium]|nr:isoleucine--tRNA ligase [Myxococcales bacterium]
MDPKSTVHLPKTDFPMRAALSEREPAQVKAWEDDKVYEQLLAKNAKAEKFVFHDGPPYANGAIHQGHFLNKILKDLVVKYHLLAGHLTDFVPGWDCHGLPIERQVDKQLGAKKRELSVAQFRKACRKYAEEQIDVQRQDFKRLGIFARWGQPYETMDFRYEADIVRELARVVRRGALYRRKRPVHWCFHDVTALAEAEVEYADKTSPSIYVRFPVVAGGPPEWGLAIWTTTPWTIPANLAITANPDLEYVAYDLPGHGITVVAKDLLHAFLQETAPDELSQPGEARGDDLLSAARATGVTLKHPARVVKTLSGGELSGWKYRHPLVARDSPVVLGAHATSDAGTGLVHTAPGHGEDDFNMGVQYGLPIWAPVDGQGRFTSDVGIPGLEGVKVFDANPKVIEALAGAGVLLNQGGKAGQIRHSYPHCWRCKNPVIFRATDQWWIGLDLDIELPRRGRTTIRKAALEAIDEIAARGGFIPSWGKERIRSMVEGRPDWCVSRQRAWGVPIPVFYCAKDREPLVSADAMENVALAFDKEGADAWFDRSARELLPAGTRCAKCGGTEFEKETDILDVWFDSGSSFAAVLGSGVWPDLKLPADLYLEGSDQHRGWFMSSLMIGIATRGEPPYKALLTHGFLVDGHGHKMSKSMGNAPDPQGLLKKYGAELMRLWVAGSDYRDDVGFSNSIVETLTESYRKIRNTLRYCLSQLFDFDPAQDSVPAEALLPVDRWALSRFERYRASVIASYDTYEFHKVYRATVDLCTMDLSAFYFDVLKDRTYCSGKRWPERRAAQTVLYRIVRDLCRLLAPVLSFTSEEAWRYVPRREAASVFLAGFPAAEPALVSDSLEEEFRVLGELRAVVNLALEQKRAAKEIGKATEADVTLTVPSGMAREVAERYEKQLGDLFLCASVSLRAGDTAAAEVRKSPHRPCDRCWRALPDVGDEGLCARCRRAVSEG